MNQQINLYQSMFRPPTVRLRAVALTRIVAIAMAGLVALYAYAWLQLRPLERRAAAATAQVASSEARVAALRDVYPVRIADAAIKRDLERKQLTLGQTQQIALKLRSGAYGSIDGLSVYLEGFARQHREGTWLTRVRVEAGGVAIGIEGKTLLPELVPAYIERLAQEPAFQGKTFSSLELKTLSDGLDEIVFSFSTSGLRPEDDS